MRKRVLVGFIALGVSSVACAAILGIDDPIDRVAADAATGDGATDAGVCAPPSCEGRCGALTNECGTVQCGNACARGRLCDETTGQCTCPSHCGASRCGTIANGCGEPVSCGTCDAGESCQTPDGGTVDAGLQCGAGTCIEPSPSSVCAGACGPITTACGTLVTCSGCGDAGFCINSACTCPTPDVTIRRYGNDSNAYCQSVDGVASCPNHLKQAGIIGRLYSNLGDSDLYRCEINGDYVLSVDCSHPFAGSAAIRIGKCLSTPTCGTVPIRQFKMSVGLTDYYYETTDPNEQPSGYTYVGDLCYIFPGP